MDHELDLLTQAQAGDPAAFERLVRVEAERLHSLAFRVTGDSHLAEDIVQDVFTGIIQRRAPYRGEGSARGWLMRATVRRAIDSKRRHQASRRRESGYALQREAEAQSPRSSLEPDEPTLLASALETLPAETKACLWLHCAEGLTVREVAECVGKRHATVGERIRRGLDRLREELRRRGLAVVPVAPLREAFETLSKTGPPPATLVQNILESRPRSPMSMMPRARGAWLPMRPLLWTGAAALLSAGVITLALRFGPSASPPVTVIEARGPALPGIQARGRPPAETDALPSEAAASREASPATGATDGEALKDTRPAPPERHALRVVVLDEEEMPVARASGSIQRGVLLSQRKAVEGKPTFAVVEGGLHEEFQSGPDGSFTWSGLKAGAYRVEIDTQKYWPRREVIEVPQNSEVVLRIRPVPYLTGRVFLGDREHPLRNSRIEYGHAIPPWNNDEERLDGNSVFETDGEGRFTLDCSSLQSMFRHEWPPGEHTFVFRHERSRVTTIKSLVSSERLEVPVDVVLELAVTVRGVLQTDAGVPIPSTRIRWNRPGADPLAQIQCVSGPDGAFAVPNLQPAKYLVTIDGFASESVLQKEVELTEEPEQPVTLAVPCFARLRVRVVEPAGSPVPGVSVALKWEHRSPGGFVEAKRSRSDETSADGYADIICLQRGIPITLGGEGHGKAFPTDPVTVTQRVEGETVVLRPKARGKVKGRVVDLEGHGVPGAVVALRGMATRSRVSGMGGPVRADPDGKFEVQLSPGRHSLEARAGKLGAGFADGVQPSLGNDELELEITLGSKDAVRVHVAGADGKPIRGAMVGIQPDDASSASTSSFSWRHEDTDDDGWVAFGAAPGTYRLKVLETRGLHHFGVVEGVRPGGDPIEIALEPADARSVSGVVLLDGRPAAGARVGICESRGKHAVSQTLTTSDGDGSFTLVGLEASQFLVVAIGPGFSGARSRPVSLPDRGRVDGVQVEALTGEDLQVKVLDPEKKPVPGASVRLQPTEECGLDAESTASEDGVATLSRLPRGTFRIFAQSARGRLASQTPLDWSGSGDTVTVVLQATRE